jgi:CheY-like chemotaxis protein
MDNKAILIIDDDSRNVFALTAVLKAKGFYSISAPDAQTGIRLLEDGANTGLILMDMMMPDMDGYEAVGILKKDEKYAHIPVVAVTAQAMVGDKERCLEAGADDYLSKPIDMDLLVRLLHKYL